MLWPLFAFFSFQTPFSCFLELFSFFWSLRWFFALHSITLCCLPVWCQAPERCLVAPRVFVAVLWQKFHPSLKRQMAKCTASFTMASPLMSSLGLRPQMTPWRDSFWFRVFPVLHLANSAGSLSLWNMGFTASTIAAFRTFSLSGVA